MISCAKYLLEALGGGLGEVSVTENIVMMDTISLDHVGPRLIGLLVAVVTAYAFFRLPGFIRASHHKFSLEAGEGKYKWLEDPFSS